MSEENNIEEPNKDISIDDFQRAYGINFSDAIDIDSWKIGENLAELYPLIENEIIKSKKDEASTHKTIRDTVFPRIQEKANVEYAGLHANLESQTIQKVHRGFLFNQAVTACGSVSAVHDTVPISITQIGVCLVNYQGQHGSYSHRLFRRDLRHKSEDYVQETLKLLEKRESSSSSKNNRAQLSKLAVRGIKAYAEKAILLDKSDSKWLMGSGSPTPYELMTGFWASRTEMKDRSIDLMRKMLLDHKRFVYIQSCARNHL